MTIIEKLKRRGLSNLLLRQVLAEFFGTMILVMFISGSVAQVVLTKGQGGTFFTINWAVGLGITMGVYASGGVSGGHINPAVTLAMATLGKCKWIQVPLYMVAQYFGAICGAGFVNLAYIDTFANYEGGSTHLESTAGIFGTFPKEYVSVGSGFATEAIGTALLVIVINAVTDKRNMEVPKGLVPLIIGLAGAAIGMSFGINTGFALNPARDLGPRIYSALAGWPNVFSYNNYNWFWVPVVAPHIGALFGAWMYALLIEMHWGEDEDADKNGKQSPVSEMAGAFNKIHPDHHRSYPKITNAFED